jgi:hypothetical protein
MDHQQAVIIIFRRHIAIAVQINDPEGPFISIEHGIDVFMAVLAIWIAVPILLPGIGRIDQVFLLIIEVHILDPWQHIDIVNGILKGGPVIGKHGVIKRPLHNGADIASALFAYFVQMSLTDPPEYDSEGDEKKQG